jgi:glycosyltransferase involved in cell wall biosynthesis
VIWHVRVIESEGWYDRYLTGLCHKLVVVSKAVEKRFNWLLSKNPEKVTVIHNGADIREFCPIISGDDVRSEFNLKHNVPVAGIVGNLLVWKGQEYFIRAASEVRKVIPSAMFLIVGDGECRHDLERSSEKLGIRDKVIFTGRRIDIPTLMAAMNVIVHSSITPEPFARVILEAMAMGKPVIAMNEGGVPEVIEDGVNGISIPPKNASLMARKIIGLLSDRDKAKKMGQAARKRIEEHFSIEANVKKIQKEYLQILKV